GASGYLIKNAMSEEVLEGIETVAKGETFLCHEIDLLMKRSPEKNIWLSDRERELLRRISEGWTNGEIADKIFLSPETIRGYRKNLLLKLGAKNTAVLVKMAVEQKLISQKKSLSCFGKGFFILSRNDDYIIPPMPPPIGGAPAPAPASSGSSANTHSVVNNMEAIEAAFSNATRDTFVGSITPAPIKFSKTSVRAL